MLNITDYITKMDLKTYQVLSLMSKAALSANEHTQGANGIHNQVRRW